MDLSEKLREERKKAGYKQNDIAEKLGITKSTYSGYETGRRKPDADTINKICVILGIDPNTLMGYESTPEDIIVEYMRLIRLLDIKEIEIIKDFKKRGLSLVDVVADLKSLADKYK